MLCFIYCDEVGCVSECEIELLCLVFWGGIWMLGIWCWLCVDFCNFWLDCIDVVEDIGECFIECFVNNFDVYFMVMCVYYVGMD